MQKTRHGRENHLGQPLRIRPYSRSADHAHSSFVPPRPLLPRRLSSPGRVPPRDCGDRIHRSDLRSLAGLTSVPFTHVQIDDGAPSSMHAETIWRSRRRRVPRPDRGRREWDDLLVRASLLDAPHRDPRLRDDRPVEHRHRGGGCRRGWRAGPGRLRLVRQPVHRLVREPRLGRILELPRDRKPARARHRGRRPGPRRRPRPGHAAAGRQRQRDRVLAPGELGLDTEDRHGPDRRGSAPGRPRHRRRPRRGDRRQLVREHRRPDGGELERAGVRHRCRLEPRRHLPVRR